MTSNASIFFSFDANGDSSAKTRIKRTFFACFSVGEVGGNNVVSTIQALLVVLLGLCMWRRCNCVWEYIYSILLFRFRAPTHALSECRCVYVYMCVQWGKKSTNSANKKHVYLAKPTTADWSPVSKLNVCRFVSGVVWYLRKQCWKVLRNSNAVSVAT